jgi:Lon protease-like protein
VNDPTPAQLAPALASLPIFPLPSVTLFPGTAIPLHVFEPRYRRMIDDILDVHRALAIAMLDPDGTPDGYSRPPVHRVAGVGVIKRAVRLTDGRFNIEVQGILRADISDEITPAAAVPYRRVRARVLPEITRDGDGELESGAASLRALCTRLISELAKGDAEMIRQLNEITDPGQLADQIAAAVIPEASERQRVLAELDVVERIRLTSGALGELLLRAESGRSVPRASGGWGVGTGKA